MKLKVNDFLPYVGGNTKLIISEAPAPDFLFHELWRSIVDDLDWINIPYKDRYIDHISVVNGEDWLQILI